MKLAARAITYLFLAMLFFFMVKPEILFDILNSSNSSWLYVGALIRIVYGVTLIGASGQSRFPFGVAAFGVLLIGGGIMLPIIGVEGVHNIVDEIYGENVTLFRGAGLLSLSLFMFVLYALRPPSEESEVPESPEA
ncbi:MAG: hypothetical protein VCD00_00890 [Candidatus Hydrogenedentota bacterium]